MAGRGFAAAAAAFGGLGGYQAHPHCREQISQTCVPTAERPWACFDQFQSCMAGGAVFEPFPPGWRPATTATEASNYGLVPAAYAGVAESVAAPILGLPTEASQEETAMYWELMEASELDDQLNEEDVDQTVQANIKVMFGIPATPDALVAYTATADGGNNGGNEAAVPTEIDEEERYGLAPKKVQDARLAGIAKRFHKRNFKGLQKAVAKLIKEKTRLAEKKLKLYASPAAVALSVKDAFMGQAMVFAIDRSERNKQIDVAQQVNMIEEQLFVPLKEKLQANGYEAEAWTDYNVVNTPQAGNLHKRQAMLEIKWD